MSARIFSKYIKIFLFHPVTPTIDTINISKFLEIIISDLQLMHIHHIKQINCFQHLYYERLDRHDLLSPSIIFKRLRMPISAINIGRPYQLRPIELAQTVGRRRDISPIDRRR